MTAAPVDPLHARSIFVKIAPNFDGPAGAHNVMVQASVPKDEAVSRSYRAMVARIGPDGKDRAMTACLEEAFAEILKQALS